MSDVDIGNDEGGGPDYPPYKEDFFQRIVNVQWQKSVPVEFSNFGNLTLGASIAGLSKSVISFWFRVPQATLENAYNIMLNNIDLNSLDLTLNGIVSLLTWGATTTATNFDPTVSGESVVTTFGPSYIGVSVGSGDPANTPPNLAIRLQSPNMATIMTDFSNRTEGNFYQIGQQDVNYSYSSGSDVIVAADVWHHLLLSFDVTGPKGTIWLAFDDYNYNGPYLAPANLQALSVSGYGLNDITATYTSDFVNAVVVDGSLSGGDFSMTNYPFAVPIINSMASNYGMEPIEMADLQVFTGMTLDTSVTSNRRAFIDSKGKPVGASSGSIKLLHKQPDVLFSSLSNWLSGHNAGTGGQFDYAPTIKKYEIKPALGS